MGEMEMSRAQQLAIIDRQIAEWNEVRYNAELAAKVHARIGLKDQAKPYAERVVQALKAMKVLHAMRAELASEAEPAAPPDRA